LAFCLAASPAFAASSNAPSSPSATNSILTINLPPAVAGESYTQQIGFESFDPATEMMTATSGLPAGMSLSPTGVLSAEVSPAAGTYTIQASVSPAPAAASTGVIDIALTVAAPGSAIAETTQGRSPAAAPAITPLVAPSLGGRIACAGYPGCNTSTSTFGADAIGHPMTQWSETGSNWNGACNYANFPVTITNNANGQYMGVYIDNEVDSPGSFSERSALVSCAWQYGAEVILVGMYPSEQHNVIDMPNGEPAGTMLEWYPYCNGTATYSANPPHPGNMGSEGYVVQQYYVPPGCSSGATGTEHQSEWNAAWNGYGGYSGINSIYDYWINSLGRQIWSPWGDLLASY